MPRTDLQRTWATLTTATNRDLRARRRGSGPSSANANHLATRPGGSTTAASRAPRTYANNV
eukprot:7862863-Lingulodinium_polyedra.AAC.1